MGSTLSVKVTADVVDLQVKFATAKAEVSSLTSELNKLARQSAEGIVGSNTAAEMTNVSSALLKAKSAAAGFSSQIRESAGSASSFGQEIEQARNKMSGLFMATGAAAAYEAITKVTSAIAAMGEKAQQTLNMADVLGVTVAQFQAMSIAAEEVGVGDEQLMRGNERLVETMREAAAGSGEAITKLKDLGFTSAQTADKSLGLEQAMAIIGPRLRDATIHANEMAAATALLGGRAVLVAKVWEHFGASAKEVADANARMNALSGQQDQMAADQGKHWKELGSQILNTTEKIWLYGEATVEAMNGSQQPLDNLLRASAQADAALQQLDHAGDRTGVIQRTNAAAQAQVAAQAAVTRATLASEQEQVEAAATGSAQRLAIAQQFYRDSLQYYGNAAVPEVRSAYREMQGAQKEYNSSQTGAFRDELERFRDSMNQQVEAFKQSKREIDEIARQSQQMVSQNTNADIAISRSAIEAKKSIIESEVATTAQAVAQKYSLLKQFAAQEYALDLQSLQDELSTLSDLPVEYNRVFNEIRVLKAKEVADLAALDHQAAAGANKAAQDQAKGWKDAVGEIESAESSLVSDVLSRRKSLSQSLIQMSGQLVEREIANDLRAMTTSILLSNQAGSAQKAAEQGGLLYHLAVQMQQLVATRMSQAGQTAAVTAGGTERTAATAAAAAASKGVAATSGSQSVMADAAKAAAGVYASVAQIPYVGYILAPIAATAAYTVVAGYESLASMDTGAWNVPHDMPAYIHQGETVMPKSFAEEARSNGFGLGNGSGGGGDTHYHEHNWNVSMLDGSSLQRFASDPIVQRRVSHFIASRTVPGTRGGNSRAVIR